MKINIIKEPRNSTLIYLLTRRYRTLLFVEPNQWMFGASYLASV